MLNIDQITEYAKSVLSEKRFVHTVNVAEEAKRLALIWGEDPKSAYLAGMVHDIAKELPEEEEEKLLQSPEIAELPMADVERHGLLGAVIARDRLGITNEDVLAAVRYHTTGRVGMSALEKIVYVADFTEVGRTFPEAEEVRKISERNLDEAVLHEADHVIKFIIDSGRILHPSTVEVRNSFLTKIKEVKTDES